ncbi:uncharacterized protein [Branchiostoma lanceolatum]|uniref:uncharacterized protein n=1 Tax=Branchiostoma lanceolatum TaxID=7740 RepID=UPI00345624A0
MFDQYAAIPPQNIQSGWSHEWQHVILLSAVLAIIVVAIQQIHTLLQKVNITQNTQAETVNKIKVKGDGNISINAGKNSTIVINTSPPVPEENLHHSLSSKSQQKSSKHLHFSDEDKLVLAVSRHVSKSPRLNTKTQVTCRKYIDNLAQLSAEGKILKCRSTIAKLLKTKTDPDSQVSLRHAATLNAINEGDFRKANRLLGEVEILLPDTRNEDEHRLRWYHQKSLIKLREGKHAAGIVLTNEALSLLDSVTPGCISAWLLINHAWFLTKVAVDEDDADERKSYMKQAEQFYQRAIEHAEREYPRQMPNFQSRVPQFAYIGLALLYLGCWQSVDNSRLGISTDVPLDDIRKANNVIAAVDKEGPVCNVSKFLLTIAKACLQYRLSNHQDAYDLAKEAKHFATEHSFSRFVDFADSLVQYLQHFV